LRSGATVRDDRNRLSISRAAAATLIAATQRPTQKAMGQDALRSQMDTDLLPRVGYSARSGPDLRAGLQQPPMSSMPVEYLTPAVEDRAVEVLTLLADRGQHRAPSVPDLIIAATAELAGLTVLHLEKGFEVIASVTGQSVERLAIR
jgi:predicted nucleic acid-binding protein